MSTVLGLLLRVVWIVSGLILLASFLFAITVAGLVWGLRYVWGQLTGKPITPFIFAKFSQSHGGQSGRSGNWGAFKSASDIWSNKAKEPLDQRMKTHEVTHDVTDVESRPSRSSD